MAKKSLGQHFLKNKSAIGVIVRSLDAQPGETIIEVGPGRGELTTELQAANRKSKIIAIEKDGELCERLKELKIDGLEIIHGDALEILPKLAAQFWKLEIGNWKLLGNIPYYITGHLLRIIGELPPEQKPERCVFTIQKEVAERIVAEEEGMNRLAASIAYWASAKIVMNLAPEDFTPAPNVASAIIVLNRKDHPAFPEQERYYTAIRALFAQPRKTTLNNLSHALEIKHEKQGGAGKEKLAASLQDIGILPESRPQDLTIENIAKITEIFF